MTDIPYTPEEAEAAAEALRYWFRFDTWSVRQGLLLLVGIDPEHVVDIEIPPDGSSLKVERKDFRSPGWFRIGFPAQIVQPLGNELMGRQPEITDFTFSGDVVMELMDLMKLWGANPEFQGMTRLEPMRFVRFAESKGLAPYWLEAVRAKGILPVDGQKTTDMPKIGSTAPLQRQRHQESEILRVLHDLGYDPKSLPKNESGKKGVKADVRSRLIFPKGVFDKAWERLLEGEISYSSESH
jgi:hypothetical protein